MKRRISIAILATCLSASLAVPVLAKKEAPPPPGVNVAAGGHFKVYVLKQAERPPEANYVPRAYQVTFLAQTLKHGTQRITRRIETLDADLLDPKSWQIADLDGDGYDDLRYLAQTTKGGCKVWPAMRWEKNYDRFTQGGPTLARFLDSRGKQVKSCALL